MSDASLNTRGLSTELAGLDVWLRTGLPPSVTWEVYPELASTNAHLLNSWAFLDEKPQALPCILAHKQNAGRGRMGRVWQSAPGGSVCWSFLWPCQAGLCPMLPVAVGLGLVWGFNEWILRGALASQVQLKWPNDVYLTQAKLAGVLCEAVYGPCGHAVVVGVGINRTSQAWACGGNVHEELSLFATEPTDFASHWQLPAPPPEPLEMAQELWPWVLRALWLLHREGANAVVDAVAPFDALRDQDLWVLEGGTGHAQRPVHALGLGLSVDGAYRVDIKGHERLVRSGDVSLRLVSGRGGVNG